MSGGGIDGLPDNELGRIVEGDIDPSYIFPDQAQHEHDHASHKEEDGHGGAVAHGNGRDHELVDDGIEHQEDAEESAEHAA